MFSSREMLLLLLDVSVKSLLLAGLAGAGLALCRVRNSHVKHCVWTAVLAAMLAMPLLVQLVPGVSVPVLGLDALLAASSTEPGTEGEGLSESAATESQRVPNDEPSLADPRPAEPGLLVEPSIPVVSEPTFPEQVALAPVDVAFPRDAEGDGLETAPAAAAPSRTLPLSMVVAAYLAIAGLFLARLLVGLWRSRQLVRSAVIVDPRSTGCQSVLRPRVELLASDAIEVPVTVGVLRPRVLLPANWTSWSEEKRQAVLQHEMTHIARRDFLVLLLAEFNRAAYWFHPLAWGLSRWLSDLAERNCDDAVIESTGDRTSYARHLLEIAAAIVGKRGRIAPTGVSMARESGVETRINAILDSQRPLARRIGWRGTAVLLAIALPAVMISAALRAGGSDDLAASEKPAAAEAGGSPLHIRGRVLGPDAKPVAGARLYVASYSKTPPEPRVAATSDDEGRFEFDVDPQHFGDMQADVQVAAAAPGFGLDWASLLDDKDQPRDLTLRLTRDAPIHGRVIDLEGNPVPHATVKVELIRTTADDNLDALLKLWRQDPSNRIAVRDQLVTKRLLWPDSLGAHSTQTDAEGRFRLSGYGRDRYLNLSVRGPRIGSSHLVVLTRPSAEIAAATQGNFAPTYGTEFEHAAPPGRTVTGTIRDRATGEPLAGAYAYIGGIEAQTDQEGRYRLEGVAKADQYPIGARSDTHFYATAQAADQSGLGPITVDFELDKGVPLQVRVRDKATGRPVHAQLGYFAAADNQAVAGTAFSNQPYVGAFGATDPRGTATFVVYPGRGYLCVRAMDNRFAPDYPVEPSKTRPFHMIKAVPNPLELGTYHLVREIHPDADQPTTREIHVELDSGTTLRGRVAGPDGKPLDGVIFAGKAPVRSWGGRGYEELPSSEFEAVALQRDLPRTLLFMQREKKLAAAVRVTGATQGPLSVSLQPMGSIVGQVVDADGKPRPGVVVQVQVRGNESHMGHGIPYAPLGSLAHTLFGDDQLRDQVLQRQATTNAEGKFRIEGLIAGAEFDLYGGTDNEFGKLAGDVEPECLPGRALDVGKMQIQPLPAPPPNAAAPADNSGAAVSADAPQTPVQREAAEQDNAQAPQPAVAANRLHYQGRVVTPDGQPAKGARIHLVYWVDSTDRLDPQPLAVTDADGRFEFERKKSDFPAYFEAPAWVAASIVAIADGYGLAFDNSLAFETTGNARRDMPGALLNTFTRLFGRGKPVLTLAQDDVPLRGRIVDLEGHGVAGASVQLHALWTTKNEDLSVVEEAAQRPQADYWTLRSKAGKFLNPWNNNGPTLTFVPPVKTDAEGRFELRGVGRERMATLAVSGPNIQVSLIHTRTRSGEKIVLPLEARRGPARSRTIYSAEFDHVVGPSRPVVGTITDADTKQPLAGVVIQALRLATPTVFEGRNFLVARTDQQGRFHLAGLPLGRNQILARASGDLPYLPSGAWVEIDAGADTQRDLQLKRGVWLEGRVTDKKTGEPIRGSVNYGAFVTNSYLEGALGFRRASTEWQHATDSDGRFRIPILPGRGLIGFSAESTSTYPRAVRASGTEAPHENGYYETVPMFLLPLNHHYLAAVEPQPDDQVTRLDIKLSSGRTISGRLVDEDNKRASPVYYTGFTEVYPGWAPLNGDKFEVQGYLADRPRRISFYDPKRDLAGVLIMRGDEPETVARLVKAGTIKGRIVDAQGEPRSGLTFRTGVEQRVEFGVLPMMIPGQQLYVETDEDGRFEIKGLAPGLKYRIFAMGYQKIDGMKVQTQLGYVVDGATVEPGEVRDLGDFEIKQR